MDRRNARKNAGKMLDQTIQTGKGKANVSPAEKTAREIGRAAQSGSKIARKVSDRTSSSDDVSLMSDEELRRRINRINMENQYAQLSSRDIDSGANRVANMLETVGDVAEIAVSIATIAAIMKSLKVFAFLLATFMMTDSGMPEGLKLILWILFLLLIYNAPILTLYGTILGNKKSP